MTTAPTIINSLREAEAKKVFRWQLAQSQPVLTFLLIAFAWTWLFWLAAIPLASFVFIVPSMLELNAVIYAYVWSATQSLAVSSVYHAAYDEIRDSHREVDWLWPTGEPLGNGDDNGDRRHFAVAWQLATAAPGEE